MTAGGPHGKGHEGGRCRTCEPPWRRERLRTTSRKAATATPVSRIAMKKSSSVAVVKATSVPDTPAMRYAVTGPPPISENRDGLTLRGHQVGPHATGWGLGNW